MSICIWCRDKGNEGCQACREAGDYHYLCPDTLEFWEPGPKLPPFNELASWKPMERLAILYLVTYYATKDK